MSRRKEPADRDPQAVGLGRKRREFRQGILGQRARVLGGVLVGRDTAPARDDCFAVGRARQFQRFPTILDAILGGAQGAP